MYRDLVLGLRILSSVPAYMVKKPRLMGGLGNTRHTSKCLRVYLRVYILYFSLPALTVLCS